MEPAGTLRVRLVGHGGVQVAQPGWYPDPRARADWRYFDGVSWTSYVARGGVGGTDPIAPTLAAGARPWAPPQASGAPLAVPGPGPGPVPTRSPARPTLPTGARFLATRTGKLTSVIVGGGLLVAALVNAMGRTPPTVPAKPDVLDVHVTAPASTSLPTTRTTTTTVLATTATVLATTVGPRSTPVPAPTTTGALAPSTTDATTIPTSATPVALTTAPLDDAAAVASAAPFADPAATGGASDPGGFVQDCGEGAYRNAKGVCVPRPVAASAPPAGATAHCNDGTWSFSQTHSGSCSHHGGVDYFR